MIKWVHFRLSKTTIKGIATLLPIGLPAMMVAMVNQNPEQIPDIMATSGSVGLGPDTYGDMSNTDIGRVAEGVNLAGELGRYGIDLTTRFYEITIEHSKRMPGHYRATIITTDGFGVSRYLWYENSDFHEEVIR